MSEPFKTVELSSGLQLKFYDQSNRYYGNFHKVRISVVALIPVDEALLSEDLKRLISQSVDLVSYETVLERMAVPTEQLSEVRSSLVSDFLASAGRYLTSKIFVEGLLRRRETTQKKQRIPGPIRSM